MAAACGGPRPPERHADGPLPGHARIPGPGPVPHPHRVQEQPRARAAGPRGRRPRGRRARRLLPRRQAERRNRRPAVPQRSRRVSGFPGTPARSRAGLAGAPRHAAEVRVRQRRGPLRRTGGATSAAGIAAWPRCEASPSVTAISRSREPAEASRERTPPAPRTSSSGCAARITTLVQTAAFSTGDRRSRPAGGARPPRGARRLDRPGGSRCTGPVYRRARRLPAQAAAWPGRPAGGRRAEGAQVAGEATPAPGRRVRHAGHHGDGGGPGDAQVAGRAARRARSRPRRCQRLPAAERQVGVRADPEVGAVYVRVTVAEVVAAGPPGPERRGRPRDRA